MLAPLIRTDERNEAIRALEKAVHELREVGTDPYNWKWVLIALHNAVQGYMVVILRGTNYAMIARAKAKALAAYIQLHDIHALDNADLQGFSVLFERIQDADYMRVVGVTRPFAPTPEQADDMKLLIDHRNMFIHFMPTALSINLAHINFPRIVASAADIIEYIQHCGGIYWYEDEFDRRTTDALAALRQEARAIAAQYGSTLPFE